MKSKKKARETAAAKRVRFPGIVRHARELGCRREHLWMVLMKKRVSKSLTTRYYELVAREQRA